MTDRQMQVGCSRVPLEPCTVRRSWGVGEWGSCFLADRRSAHQSGCMAKAQGTGPALLPTHPTKNSSMASTRVLLLLLLWAANDNAMPATDVVARRTEAREKHCEHSLHCRPCRHVEYGIDGATAAARVLLSHCAIFNKPPRRSQSPSRLLSRGIGERCDERVHAAVMP